jgi:hypothetical protein
METLVLMLVCGVGYIMAIECKAVSFEAAASRKILVTARQENLL